MRGIVLSRSPLGEANALITILTSELGLVRARAQGLRARGAKLASALVTFAESDLVLLRGNEQWRVAGAVRAENWARRIQSGSPHERASRVVALLLRLITGEARDAMLFPILAEFFRALATVPEELHESVEMLAVIRLLGALGLDKSDVPVEDAGASALLAEIAARRAYYVKRINRGIIASGL